MRSPTAIRLATSTTCRRVHVMSRMTKKPISRHDEQTEPAQARVCSTSRRSVGDAGVQRGRSATRRCAVWSSKIESTPRVNAGEVLRRVVALWTLARALAISAIARRTASLVAPARGGSNSGRRRSLDFERRGHRLVQLGGEELHENGVTHSAARTARRSVSRCRATPVPKPRARASDSLSSGPWKTRTSTRCFRSMLGIAVEVGRVADLAR